MKRVMQKQGQDDEAIDGPAVIAKDHVRDRVLSKTAGAKAGWSRLTVYERAFRLGQMLCKERGTHAKGGAAREEEGRALDRFAAARAFDTGWQICQAGFPGGVDFDRVRTSGGVPGGFADHQRDAKAFWRRVEQAMGANDWMICRRVCGENYAIAETVQAISPGYRFATLARFREALDALVDGMKRAKSGGRELG
ncbi:MAG TPA: hypothetical protein VLL04_00415 [Rhizomicrobium sp.]|nr:hypothetical protein [Rhizomicrobium sp.]